MDHKAFLKKLSPNQRTILTTRYNTPALIHLTLHWSLIIVIGFYIGFQWPFWGILLIPQGILISFCFCILHETVHETPFKSKRMNTLIGSICAHLIILPRNWFRYFHLAHHKYTQMPGKDPELNTPKPETLYQYLRYVSGLPVLLGNFRKITKNAFSENNDPYVPKGGKEIVKSEAIWMLALYVLIGAGLFSPYSGWIIWCWLLPLLLGQPFLRLYLLAEHGRCPVVSNMFENTRTTLTTRLMRFLAWNMPYHIEHHVYPMVPFHKLPALHEIIADNLKSTSEGYIAFNKEYFDSLK
jgi:fatty acid desaturase